MEEVIWWEGSLERRGWRVIPDWTSDAGVFLEAGLGFV